MWESRAKLIWKLCVFTLIYITVIDCRLLPVTRKLEYKKKPEIVLPKDFLEKGKLLLANAKIPNQEFCSEMILQPEDRYVVLPWWYHYCQDLREKTSKGIKGNVHFTAIHRYILDEVQAYKKRMKEKKRKISEMEKEISSI